ncbi:hypothetical protein RJ640_025740 [Escallonia rubra]|uniref:Uncharacterized protein n=1 Tax=Escallonia rubra TaxID=112253 RepID=A0AA88RKZ2_9ASTE|nr:hypothetical protein RJ640_025740 [Escallonia rubra]
MVYDRGYQYTEKEFLIGIALNNALASTICPFLTYPDNIAFQQATFLSGTASNKPLASSTLPHLAYPLNNAVQDTTFLLGISLNTLRASGILPLWTYPDTMQFQVTTFFWGISSNTWTAVLISPRLKHSRASDKSRRPSWDSGPSSADEIDDWGTAKKSTTFGIGFDRRDRGERGGIFDSQSRADESDNWVSNKSFVPSTGALRFGSNDGGL